MKRSMIQSKCNEYELNDVTNGAVQMQINEDIIDMGKGIPLKKNKQTRPIDLML